MLNIGFTELILLSVIAALFVGPDKLPELARWVGKMMRKARLLIDDLQAELQQDEDLREVQQVGKELHGEMQELKTQIQGAARDVSEAVEEGRRVFKQEGDDLGDDEEEIWRQSRLAGVGPGAVEAAPRPDDRPPAPTEPEKSEIEAAETEPSLEAAETEPTLEAAEDEASVPPAEVTSSKPGGAEGP